MTIDWNAFTPWLLNPDEGRLRWTAPCAWAQAGTGAVSGVLSGLLGVGGGFVIVPSLSRFTNLQMRSIVATSLAVIALSRHSTPKAARCSTWSSDSLPRTRSSS